MSIRHGLQAVGVFRAPGKDVGRLAFRPLYSQQAESHTQRGLSVYTLRALGVYEEMRNKPYRRLTYRGKLTPYGRKVEKLGKRVGVLYEDINRRIGNGV